MDKKIKQLKARIITMNGSNERYMGKRKYSQMKIMRVELEKIRVMDIRKLGNNYSKKLFNSNKTKFDGYTTLLLVEITCRIILN